MGHTQLCNHSGAIHLQNRSSPSLDCPSSASALKAVIRDGLHSPSFLYRHPRCNIVEDSLYLHSLQTTGDILLSGCIVQSLALEPNLLQPLPSPGSSLALGLGHHPTRPIPCQQSRAYGYIGRACRLLLNSNSRLCLANRRCHAFQLGRMHLFDSGTKRPAVATSLIASAWFRVPAHSAAQCSLDRHAFVAFLFKEQAQMRHRAPARSSSSSVPVF